MAHNSARGSPTPLKIGSVLTRAGRYAVHWLARKRRGLGLALWVWKYFHSFTWRKVEVRFVRRYLQARTLLIKIKAPQIIEELRCEAERTPHLLDTLESFQTLNLLIAVLSLLISLSRDTED